MPGIADFLHGLGRVMGITQQPPVWGNDLPSQGGITGTMYGDQDPYSVGVPSYPIPPPAQSPAQSPYPMGSDIGGQAGGILDNPILNPTVDPQTAANMPLQPGFEAGMMGVPKEEESYLDRYKPSHTAQDYYNQLMLQYPTRNMHPSIMRRLAASFAGFGEGPKGAEEVMEAPYNRAVTDWKNKMQPALSSANLERYENVNERQLLSQAERERVANRRADTYQQDVTRKEAADRAKEESNRANRAFRYYKVQHPNHIYKEDRQGNVYSIDPQTDEHMYITDTNGDMIQGPKLPEEDRMEIQHTNRMEEIGAQGENAQGRADEAGWGTYTDENGNPIDYNVRTGQTRKSGLPKGTGKTGTLKPGATGKQSSFQDAQRQRNIARQILNTDPNAVGWISMDSNQVTIDPDHKYADADPQTQAYVRHLRDTIYAQTPELPVPKNDRSVPGIDTKPEGPPADPSKRKIGDTKTFPNGNVGVWDGKNWRQVEKK